MEISTYKNLKLRVYTNWVEYEEKEEIKSGFTDADGNPVEVDITQIDFSMSESREHFEDDSEFKKDDFYWEAWNDEQTDKGIVCIFLNESDKSIEHKELFKIVGHEYGHIIDGEKFKNSTASYDTDEGYEQEEKKAMAFESFVEDVYEMTKLFSDMLRKMNVEILNQV